MRRKRLVNLYYLVMKKYLALVLGAVAAVMFVSCSDNSKQDVSQEVNTDPAVKGTYELTLAPSSRATDQKDIIKTVITAGGKEYEFTSDKDKFTLKPETDFAIPHQETITVTQTVKEGVSLTKDNYNMGLGYRFEVKSLNNKGGVAYNQNLEDLDYYASVKKEKLDGNYKVVYNFSFSINAAGEISDLRKH